MADVYASYPFVGVSGGVTTLNGESGAVVLVAGTGITVTPAGQNITIATTALSAAVTSINTDTASAQILSVGTSGTDFAITDPGSGSHVFNLPTASASNRGALSSADWSTFNSKQSAGTYVTAITVASSNGLAGSSSGGATPALTLSTSITGLLKGNGTAISAATASTDYSLGTSGLATGILKSTTTTGALTIAVAGDFPTLNQNTSGNAATVTTNANLTGDVTSVGNATTAAATQANIVTLSKSTGVSVHGSNTNDSASSGYVGEYIESQVTTATNFASTGTWGDLTSISLTAGDWDVTLFMVAKANGATVTDVSVGISTTTGNSSTGLSEGVNAIFSGFFPTVNNVIGVAIPLVRASLSGTTTYYGKGLASYSIANPQFKCILAARRVR